MPLFLNSEHYYGKRYLVVVKKTLRYSDVFLQPLMPLFRISVHSDGKRYKCRQIIRFAAGNQVIVLILQRKHYKMCFHVKLEGLFYDNSYDNISETPNPDEPVGLTIVD